MSINKDIAGSSGEESRTDGSGHSPARGGWRIKQRKEPIEKPIQKKRFSPQRNHETVLVASKAEDSKQRSSSDQNRPLAPRFKWIRAVGSQRKSLAVLLCVGLFAAGFMVFSEIDQSAKSPGKSTQLAETDATSNDIAAQTETVAGERQIRAIALPALEDEGFLPIYFRLTEPADKPVEITYETIAHTASAETDFAARNGTVTIRPGDVSVEVTIPLIDDDDIESIEMFRVRLSTDTTSAQLTDEELMATVLDDDRASSTKAN